MGKLNQVEDPKNPLENADNPAIQRASEFYQDAYKIVSRATPEWREGQDMYLECFDGLDDDVDIYNPTMLHDIVQRVLDQYKLADYQLIIPDAAEEIKEPELQEQASIIEKQIIRDAVAQVKKTSGLVAAIRDDQKGALSQLLLGNCILWWGMTSPEEEKRGKPIRFQTVRLTQAMFSSNAMFIRHPNGDNDANEGMLIFEYPKEEVDSLYPKAKRATKGRLPFVTDFQRIQEEQYDVEEENNLTQVCHYYNIEKGQYYIVVGRSCTIVESYDDNIKSLEDYPWVLDGKKYIPCEMLRTFPVVNELYSKGLFHKFGKIARGDARNRIMAHKYAESNVYPNRFIKMADDKYSTFQNDLMIANELRKEGQDSYIQLGLQDDIATGDFRTAPLSQEFERMNQDGLSQVLQGGIAMQDVDRPTSETATATAAEEIAKTRLANQITKINAGASVFLTRVVLDAIKGMPNSNKAPVATNAKLTINTPLGEFEEEVTGVTFGMASELLKKRDVFVQEDLSEFEGVGLRIAKLNAMMQFAQLSGNPSVLGSLAAEAMGIFGKPMKVQQLTPPPSEQSSIPTGIGQSEAAPQQAQAIPELR
ncbi:MAG: hypothetical protein DRN90_08030 [Thermoproteota archaeon]|nr:MAG: hypothetical protein DRN90_08030 [Candidatus Korarchaeota archaeon]